MKLFETLRHISFPNFHKGTLDFKKIMNLYITLNHQPGANPL